MSSGQTVVLKSDGTVEAVSGSSVSEEVGILNGFYGSDTDYISAVYDTASNKVVVAYQGQVVADGTKYGKAVVGTISGTSISFGSSVNFATYGAGQQSALYISAVYDPNANKTVIFYRDQSNSERGTAIVGTVSGTSISFGSPVVFNSTGASNFNSAVYDPDTQKIVNFYKDEQNSSYGTAIVGTVSGTSISFGSEVVFEAGDSEFISAAYDTTENKMVVVYRDNANSLYGTAIVGTVSGTSISFGSPVVFNAGDTRDIEIAYSPSAGKVVVAYSDYGNSNRGTAIVGTVSGTSISFGTEAVFDSSGTAGFKSVLFHVAASTILIFWQDGGSANYGRVVSATITGESISFSTSTVFQSTNAKDISATYDSTNGKALVAFANTQDDGKIKTYVPAYTITNNTDFIGITAEAISDTATGAVNVYGGINEAQTGLTIGSDYYVQDDGSLSTTASSVKVGQAISATTINMMDLT